VTSGRTLSHTVPETGGTARDLRRHGHVQQGPHGANSTISSSATASAEANDVAAGVRRTVAQPTERTLWSADTHLTYECAVHADGDGRESHAP
jgi:hypothetical protein